MKKITKEFQELAGEYKGVFLTGECADSDVMIHSYEIGGDQWLTLYQKTHLGGGETELVQVNLCEGMVEKLRDFLNNNMDRKH